MNYRLDHIALNCRDSSESVSFYEKHFGGTPTATRTGGDGRSFCFVNIGGSTPIQLIESPVDAGINHYGFVADDIDQVVTELRAKNAEILREIRDPNGKLTTIFVKDANGFKMEVRLPR